MVQADALSFEYKKGEPLFKALDLRLSNGNIYGLLGTNGAGKSTLLKLLTGLLFPGGGTLSVLDTAPHHRLPGFLQEIYMVNEEFQLPDMKMEEFIRLYHPFYPRFNHEQMQQCLTDFQLPGGKKLSALSYGQKKKFLLSFGLATDCKLLILDEPTNGLDIPSKSMFRKVVANAIHENRSFIISTHQVRDMDNLIDPVIVLDGGKIVLQADCAAIAEKLCFRREKGTPQPGGLLYKEDELWGYKVVREKNNNEETPVNMELLFNAVINDHERSIQQLFNDLKK